MAAHVTYFDSNPSWVPVGSRQRVVAAIFDSQAKADADGAGAGRTAFPGAVDDSVDLGWWITTTGAGAGAVSASAPALNDTVRRRRGAARLVHGALHAWGQALTLEGVVHAAAVVAVGHDFLYHAHGAVYILAHRDILPIAQFEAWCRAMAMGAADVTSPQQFFTRMEAGQGIAAPAGPCAWVRWGHTQSEGFTTPIRTNLADAIAASGAITVQAPGNLALSSADLPSEGLAANGSWIDALAA